MKKYLTILKTYNLTDASDSVILGINDIITYVSKNKKQMLYNLQCKKNNSFIYKFDIFSMGIIP